VGQRPVNNAEWSTQNSGWQKCSPQRSGIQTLLRLLHSRKASVFHLTPWHIGQTICSVVSAAKFNPRQQLHFCSLFFITFLLSILRFLFFTFSCHTPFSCDSPSWPKNFALYFFCNIFFIILEAFSQPPKPLPPPDNCKVFPSVEIIFCHHVIISVFLLFLCALPKNIS